MAPLPRPTSEPSSDPFSETALPPSLPSAPTQGITSTQGPTSNPMAPPTSQVPASSPSLPGNTSTMPPTATAAAPVGMAPSWPDINSGVPVYTQPPTQSQPYSSISPYAPYAAAYTPSYAQYPNSSYAPPYTAYPTGYVYPGYSRQTVASSTPASAYPQTHAYATNTVPPSSTDAYATAPGSTAREAGAVVLNGMQEAMTRFARVSAMLEDVLRHLHMLFDAIFGLGYSLGAFRQEAGLWLALKTGPVGLIARVIRRVATVWRVLCLFFMSPLAGRFSPVALVLRILGLVPDDDGLELSLADMLPSPQDDAAGDSSNM